MPKQTAFDFAVTRGALSFFLSFRFPDRFADCFRFLRGVFFSLAISFNKKIRDPTSNVELSLFWVQFSPEMSRRNKVFRVSGSSVGHLLVSREKTTQNVEKTLYVKF